MISKKQVSLAAIEAGFMISTGHGQDADKLIPVSDVETLRMFYELMEGDANG